MSHSQTAGSVKTEPGLALVTGAAAGIGRATAAALLRDGWEVVAFDRDRDSLAQLERDLAVPSALTTRLIDLARTEDVRDIVSTLPDAVPLRGLVCCAAIGDNTSFLDVPIERLRSLLDVNFIATFALCQMVARRMSEHGGGSIVNITSTSGLRANSGRSSYGSSKAAVEMLSKVMAVELACSGVRVNTVAPGPTLTAMAAALHVGGEDERLLRSVPQGRYGKPEEIAEAVAFLLDPKRSGFVTGHTLCVDGGMYAAGTFEPNRQGR